MQEHLNGIGIDLEDVNFFTWQAFPHRSYGKFLVSEKEWIAVVGLPAEGPSPGSPAPNRKAKLIIEDANTSKEFSNLDIVSTSAFMSPIYPTGVNGQDGSRILLIELEHTASKYHKMNRVYKQYEDFDSLKSQFKDEAPRLRVPAIFNQHVISDVPLIEYLAYIASSNFLTVFLPPGESLPKLTNSQFLFPINMQLLSNKSFSLSTSLGYKVVLKDDRDCEPMDGSKTLGVCKSLYYVSDIKAVTISDTIYKSSINANSDIQNIEVIVPYALVNHIDAESNIALSYTEVNQFAEDIKGSASTRLLRNIDVTYQGLVSGSITNDVQSITYYFHNNHYGFRTRLRTIPWEMPSSQSWLHSLVSSDKVYKGVLLENIASSSAKALITNLDGKLVEISSLVFDTLGIFSTLKKGNRILLSRDASNCRFHIIQSECATASDTSPAGKCCVSLSIENGPTRSYCIETTQLVCQRIGGTFTLGGSCGGNFYCE